MVEGAIACAKRGFQSLLALWPLLIVRLVEMIVLMIISVGGFVLALVPVGLSFAFDDLESWIDDPEAVAEWLLSHAGTFFYLMIALLVLAGIAMLIHSFFEAGVAALYLDHIRSGVTFPWSEGWARFSLDAFVKAALSRGWSVFLVYNIVWGVAGAVILIPLGLLLGALLIFRDSPAAIAFTCFGLLVAMFVTVIASIVAAVWGQVALTVTAGERRGPVESSGLAGELMRARLGITILTAIIVYAVILGSSSLTSTFNFGLGALAEVRGVELVAFGLQAVLFLVNSVVSTIVGLWSAAVWAAFVASSSAAVSPVAVSANGGGTGGAGTSLVG